MTPAQLERLTTHIYLMALSFLLGVMLTRHLYQSEPMASVSVFKHSGVRHENTSTTTT